MLFALLAFVGFVFLRARWSRLYIGVACRRLARPARAIPRQGSVSMFGPKGVRLP